MGIINVLFNPAVFAGLMVLLCGGSVFVIIASSRQDKGNRELEAKLKTAQAELEKFKSELESKTQMYEGLKGQYSELEKEVERISQQKAAEVPLAKEAPSEEKARAITNLLQDLQKIQQSHSKDI